MLKVLYLPLNDATGVQQGTYDAWNNVGVQLEICDFHRIWLSTKSKTAIANDFLERVKKFQPHLIHMQLQFTGLLDATTINQARKLCPGVIITNWSGDVRADAIPSFVSIANALDYSLISSTGQIDLYKKAGCKNVRYWQIGYDPNVHFPKNYNSFKYDVSFIGNHYGNTFPDGPLRFQAAQKCLEAFGNRAGIFGAGYTHKGARNCNIKECNEIYNSSVCALSISHFNNISHYFSDRLLYCLASGRPTISWYFPGCENYFVEGSEIFYARNNQDIVNIVNYCRNNQYKATEIGMNGFRKVFREHTYTSRIIELLHLTKLMDRV